MNWLEEMTNAFLENIEEMFVINMLCKKDNWIGYILFIVIHLEDR